MNKTSTSKFQTFCPYMYKTFSPKTFFATEVDLARPSKFDRDQALSSAMQIVWRNGYEASSVKALSEELGMTRSSFYNAFHSREDLFRELVALYAPQSPDAPLGDEPEGPVLALITRVYHDICRARANDAEGRGCMLVNTVSEVCPSPEGLGPELAQILLGSAARIETLLLKAQKNGEIGPEANPHALALALQNLMVGLNVLCKVVRDEQELWLLARTTLEGLGLFDPSAL